MALAGGAVVIVYGARNVTSAVTSANAAPTSTTSSSSSAAPPSSSAAPATVSAAVAQVAATHGWGASEITAWLAVIADEDASGSLTATNPTSGAYGIAQFINGAGEYAQYGGSPDTLVGQLTAMGNYIADRYGTPSGAIAHENASHWY